MGGAVVLPCDAPEEASSAPQVVATGNATTASAVVTTTMAYLAQTSGIPCAQIAAAVNVTEAVHYPGSRCYEASSQGWFAFLSVPVEQMSAIWCEFGAWAPMGIGMFLYITHSFAYSIAAEQCAVYNAKARQIAHKAELRRIHDEMMKPKKQEIKKPRPNEYALAIFHE